MYEINIGLDGVDAATAERVYNAVHDVLADVPEYWRPTSYAVLRDRETKLYYHADDQRWATGCGGIRSGVCSKTVRPDRLRQLPIATMRGYWRMVSGHRKATRRSEGNVCTATPLGSYSLVDGRFSGRPDGCWSTERAWHPCGCESDVITLKFKVPDFSNRQTRWRAYVLVVVAMIITTLLWLNGYTEARHARQYEMYLRHQETATTQSFDQQYPFPPHKHAPGTPEHEHGNAFDIEHLDGYGNARDTRNGLVFNVEKQYWQQP